jgi:exosome complex component RRP43
MCSSKFRPGPPSEQAQAVSEAINRVLKESKVLDLKDLCIEEGKAVWVLYVDAVCVAYDGNIFDAALAAIMAALKNGTNKLKENCPIVVYNIRFTNNLSSICFDTRPFLVRIRKPTYQEGTIKVSGGSTATDENSFTLNLARTPLSATFAIFDTTLTILADPNVTEETISDGQISIALDETGQLCGVTKIGASSCSQSVMRDCVQSAKKRTQQLRDIMNQQ